LIAPGALWRGGSAALDAGVRPWAAQSRLHAGLYEFLLFGLRMRRTPTPLRGVTSRA